MNRILITVALACVVLSVSTANAQSWMFQPGKYSSNTQVSASAQGSPSAQQAPGFPQQTPTFAQQTPTFAQQTPTSGPQPRAYATFTESQAAEAAALPKPAFQWDSTGILGRGQRYEMWSHQEAMEANRLRTYARGVRDAVGAPLWTWNGLTPQPLPQIIAPTATTSGQARPITRP